MSTATNYATLRVIFKLDTANLIVFRGNTAVNVVLQLTQAITLFIL